MKRRCALLLPLFFALLLALAASGCAAASGNSGRVLRIGVREDIPDFGYRNPDSDRFYGMEIDIAEEMARRMGYEVEFIADTAQARADLLNTGAADCLVACFTITDERRERFDFSAPYYHDDTVAVAELSCLYGWFKSLRNARIGVLEGSTAADLFAAGMESVGYHEKTEGSDEGYTIAAYESYDALSDALERGDIDAMCMDHSIAKKYMNTGMGRNDNTLAGDDPGAVQEGDLEGTIEGDRVSYVVPGGAQAYGVATNKGSPLSAPIAATIDEMLADGTIDAIREKWM